MGLSKKIRFEVFKRDKFTCQYCGRSAPDVVLHVDHIKPKVDGGDSEILNLITSCQDCNLGKGAIPLSDDAVITKQRQQLEALQERREQLEMMLEWHRELANLKQDEIEALSQFWSELIPRYNLNENGKKSLSQWRRRFGLIELLESMRIASEQYVKYPFEPEQDPGTPTAESVAHAFDMIPRICANRRREQDKPYLKDLYYIRGILRNRLSYLKEWEAMQLMENAILSGVSATYLQDLSKSVKNWTEFRTTVEAWIENGINVAPADEPTDQKEGSHEHENAGT